MKTIPQKLHYSTFKELEGATFDLIDIKGNIEKLKLSELTYFPSHHSASKDPKAYPFSLIFHVQDPNLTVPQGIYTLAHLEIGEQLLFVVPIQPDADGNRLEVIIN